MEQLGAHLKQKIERDLKQAELEELLHQLLEIVEDEV